MSIQVILNQQVGPLPVSATFSALSDAPSTLIVSGSVWSVAANQSIGIAIQLDGVQVGTAQIFSNGGSTHRAVVPSYIPIKLQQGNHTLTLALLPNSQTTSDFNDYFTAVIDY
jgi:hypothetical protein